VRLDSTLREETQRGAGVRVLANAEDLNVHAGISTGEALDTIRVGPFEGMDSHTYRAAWWLPGPHLQTLWGKLARRRPRLPIRTERWDTPDSDFLEVVRTEGSPGRPRLIVLHGLEGGPRSHYALGLLAQARRREWPADVLVFRSCGGELNRALRFYHSGETTDLGFAVDRLIADEPNRTLLLAGVSLGGNVLLKWLGEQGDSLPRQVAGAAAVSVPYDLERGSRRIQTGFSRVYQAHFLRSLRRKAHAKRLRYPDHLQAAAIDAARSLYDYDDAVTAPIHGFHNARHYYSSSSATRWIDRIRVPTLLISALDDPFLPSDVLDTVREIASHNESLTIEFLDKGGHAGFVTGRVPWRAGYYAEQRVAEFLAALPARVVPEGADQ
jgi:predicted alpha/beta-fold hydrolase